MCLLLIRNIAEHIIYLSKSYIYVKTFISCEIVSLV